MTAGRHARDMLVLLGPAEQLALGATGVRLLRAGAPACQALWLPTDAVAPAMPRRPGAWPACSAAPAPARHACCGTRPSKWCHWAGRSRLPLTACGARLARPGCWHEGAIGTAAAAASPGGRMAGAAGPDDLAAPLGRSAAAPASRWSVRMRRHAARESRRRPGRRWRASCGAAAYERLLISEWADGRRARPTNSCAAPPAMANCCSRGRNPSASATLAAQRRAVRCRAGAAGRTAPGAPGAVHPAGAPRRTGPALNFAGGSCRSPACFTMSRACKACAACSARAPAPSSVRPAWKNGTPCWGTRPSIAGWSAMRPRLVRRRRIRASSCGAPGSGRSSPSTWSRGAATAAWCCRCPRRPMGCACCAVRSTSPTRVRTW